MLGDWQGHMTSSKYARLAKCFTDTALRDLRELVERGILVRNEGGGRSKSYRLADLPASHEALAPPLCPPKSLPCTELFGQFEDGVRRHGLDTVIEFAVLRFFILSVNEAFWKQIERRWKKSRVDCREGIGVEISELHLQVKWFSWLIGYLGPSFNIRN